MVTRENVQSATRTLRQLASDPLLKKSFASAERKTLNDAANILRDYQTEVLETRESQATLSQ